MHIISRSPMEQKLGPISAEFHALAVECGEVGAEALPP